MNDLQPPHNSQVELWTSRQAAQALGISERTLWGLMRSGAIPCVPIGRSVRYDPADLRAWIAARKVRRTLDAKPDDLSPTAEAD